MKTCVPRLADVPGSSSTESLILDSARRELAVSGILGLRVAEVANGAHCSITNIYRYFGDRDGLLARVLGDMYDEFTRSAIDTYLGHFADRHDLTVQDLADRIPFPTSPEAIRIQAFRLQILAAATENPRLHARLEEISQNRMIRWREGVQFLRERMAPGEEFDERVFYVMLANHMPYYNYLLGESKMTEAEFQRFIADKLRCNPQPRN